ncbi:thioredoxin domain-containing protein [Streptomyces sp. NPDC048436]|uniref:thioredoxin domain-containing protein n=1 Tax=Streptomyces sp. NPDC048436 TaxID=3365550 RepID=UPI00371C147C
MTPANTTGADGATVYYGELDSPHSLDVFLELRDQASGHTAESLLGTMRQAADEGRFLVKFHFAALMDDVVGGNGSLRGLSALAAASDVGQPKFIEYLAALFAAQPSPPGIDSFSDSSFLLAEASHVEGLRSPEFDRKITADTYLSWAGDAVGSFASFNLAGTPVVWYDGAAIPVVKMEGGFERGPAFTPQEFLAQLSRMTEG